MANDLDLSLGRLEDGLERPRSLVLAIEEDTANELFRCERILHWRVGIADCHTAAE